MSEVRSQRSGTLKYDIHGILLRRRRGGLLPDRVMLNTHPQRWDDRFGAWVKGWYGRM